MENLQELGKIGKSVLVQLVGIQMNFKTIKYIESIDDKKCTSLDCPIYDLKNAEPSKRVSEEHLAELEALYCYGKCKEAIVSTPKVVYTNESNQFGIPKDRKRLSSLQVKQLILYHFYKVDKFGVVKNISTREIARILGCTEKTVRTNNDRLVDQHFIWLSPMDKDRFTILIKEYKTYHLTSKEGGNGYLEFTKKLLGEILSISNVNALRLEIRKIIHFDNYNIGKTEKNPVELSYRDIRRFLPKYVNYKSLISEIISKESDAFSTTEEESGIKFELKKEFRADEVIKTLSYEYSEKIQELLDNNGVELDIKDKQDFIQMSFEYNFETVYQAIEQLIENYIKKGNKVDTPGALVRTISRGILRVKMTA